MDPKTMTKADICTHHGDDYDRHLGAIVPPLYQNSLFTRKKMNHGYTYTRVSNPTIELAEKKIAALEGGEEARCFSSGMGAISAVLMQVLERDSHIICPKAVYVPTKVFLETYMGRFGVEVTFVSGESLEEFSQAIRPNTKAIYLETPLSNLFTLQDLAGVAALARPHGITTIVDNTWATPLYQNPLAFGIDLVVHSASKYLGGHSDILGGAAVGSRERMQSLADNERSLFGAVMDPHQAWLLARGLRTLPLRMKQHQESALQVAAFLEAHPLVERVLYPGLASHPQHELAKRQMTGFSGLLSFVPKGTPEQIRSMMKSLDIFEEGPSWGGFESLINSPGLGIDAETSRRIGIPLGLLRISVGLESLESIIGDLDRALTSHCR
ncbi:Cystathionine beta-lyase/cystathionine gamma-synthase [Paenibacillus sp. UNCCL117]|uniref:trans-sulfuration enzyme family protein n=1 Tax=unclassified Paenibacillus TaxID=185978 RepID=UPI00088BA0BF|nr:MULTISPECIES: PLP-dependent aspartate aminotransferase family protein [unclassified Paenibacillus]SDC52164.1 Cystathionine beta-lyase/cystathionine gamma-synthase [Paenibacillus sp. cl123]SFW11351.1 Cystathionine beta-lyase/cystathionine gamma-synthase [Paenibacillus sp. UNCCL117]